ncbi:MAG: Ig-like domain repeat protein [Clostridia bacterium]|nr:Ig-like domain repeat protein [Deltaproteobacteria bacterium]
MSRLAFALTLFIATPALAGDIHIVETASTGLDTTKAGVVTCPVASCDLQASTITTALTVLADDIVVETPVTNDALLTLRADATCAGRGKVSASLGQIGGATVYTHDGQAALASAGVSNVTTLIDTLADLVNINGSRDYALNCDIAGSSVANLGMFSGSLDGQLHAITDLAPSGAGMFEILENGADIHDLVLVRPVVKNTAAATGSLTGTANVGATINNVAVLAASVEGRGSTGGLIGTIKGATVSGVYVTGTVSGTTDVGGVVGLLDGMSGNTGTLSNAASKAAVTGTGAAGGLVGSVTDLALVGASWSAGAVSGGGAVGGGEATSVSASVYWDTTTSGQATSNGGTGLATAQMHVQSNFTGFDFDVSWAIRPNIGRPYPQAFATLLNLDLVVTSTGTSTVGDNVTFTTTATPATRYSPAVGAAVVRDNGTTIGNGTFASNTAQVSTSTLTVGAHAITALFRGDDFHLEVVSQQLTQTVLAPGIPVTPTTTTLVAQETEIDFGDPIVLTATVIADSGIATGAVSFTINGEVFGIATLANSTANISVTDLLSGTLAVSAIYVPDAGAFASSVSNAVTVTVGQAPPTAPFTLSIEPLNQTVYIGGAARYIMSLNGRGTVALSCGALPRAASCTFNQNSVVINNQRSMALLIVGTQEAHSGRAGPLKRPPWWLLPPMLALCGFALMRNRRRFAIFALTAALACTNDSGRAYVVTDGTPAGTYKITVTAMSPDQSSSVDVTITALDER